jgi:hypothetical protein
MVHNLSRLKTRMEGSAYRRPGGGYLRHRRPGRCAAFGTVVQNSGAFKNIVEWVLSLDMHPYICGIFATSVFSGITGSPPAVCG